MHKIELQKDEFQVVLKQLSLYEEQPDTLYANVFMQYCFLFLDKHVIWKAHLGINVPVGKQEECVWSLNNCQGCISCYQLDFSFHCLLEIHSMFSYEKQIIEKN